MSKKQNNRYPSGIAMPDSRYETTGFHLPGQNSARKDSRPFFSFRHICQRDYCAKKLPLEKFKSYSDTLRILSEIPWSVLESSPRETHGFELLPVRSLNAAVPKDFDNRSEIMIFRFGGGGGSRNSGRIAGVRDGDNFFVLFIDRNFSLYNHGS